MDSFKHNGLNVSAQPYLVVFIFILVCIWMFFLSAYVKRGIVVVSNGAKQFILSRNVYLIGREMKMTMTVLS